MARRWLTCLVERTSGESPWYVVRCSCPRVFSLRDLSHFTVINYLPRLLTQDSTNHFYYLFDGISLPEYHAVQQTVGPFPSLGPPIRTLYQTPSTSRKLCKFLEFISSLEPHLHLGDDVLIYGVKNESLLTCCCQWGQDLLGAMARWS